jgi:hypothetical protein
MKYFNFDHDHSSYLPLNSVQCTLCLLYIGNWLLIFISDICTSQRSRTSLNISYRDFSSSFKHCIFQASSSGEVVAGCKGIYDMEGLSRAPYHNTMLVS